MAGEGVQVTPIRVGQVLQADGPAAQKKSLHARERDSEANRKRREEFLAQIATIPPEKLIFLDESAGVF